MVFEKAFEKAELSKLDTAQWESYERSLKDYRDIKGYIDTAFGDGKAEGRLEGFWEVAQNAKIMGLSVQDIARLTGLSEEEISKL